MSEITSYPEGIVVSGGYDAIAAYKINLLTGHTSRIPGVHEARSWSGSEDLVVIDMKGNVERRSPGKKTRLLAYKAEEADWNYDFRNRRLYFIHDTAISLVGAHGAWTDLPWPAPFVLPEGVVPIRSVRQIWVAGGGSIGVSPGLVLYSTHGKRLRSWRFTGGDTPRPPLGLLDLITFRTLRRLDKYSRREAHIHEAYEDPLSVPANGATP